jgi:hypothetical protein
MALLSPHITAHANAGKHSLTSMDDESSALLRFGSRAPPDMPLEVAAQRFLSCRQHQWQQHQGCNTAA